MSGQRHSKQDRDRIRTARGKAREIDQLMADLGDEDEDDEAAGKLLKSLSLNSRLSAVAGAIYRVLEASLREGWADEVYDDYAIVCVGGAYYRCTYTMDDAGVVEVQPIGEWQAVEQVWADKKSAALATLVRMGGAVKKLSNGHIGGYLVRFGGPDQTDLEGDFFTKDTDFGFEGTIKSAVYFHHRMPLKTRDGGYVVVKERIGEATLSIDDVGVLVDAILYNRKEYEDALDALGWSSGTASHLVEVEQVGKSYWLKAWPLGLDASITPTPAEPRNSVVPLKSLLPAQPPLATPTPEPSTYVIIIP